MSWFSPKPVWAVTYFTWVHTKSPPRGCVREQPLSAPWKAFNAAALTHIVKSVKESSKQELLGSDFCGLTEHYLLAVLETLECVWQVRMCTLVCTLCCAPNHQIHGKCNFRNKAEQINGTWEGTFFLVIRSPTDKFNLCFLRCTKLKERKLVFSCWIHTVGSVKFRIVWCLFQCLHHLPESHGDGCLQSKNKIKGNSK